MRIQVTESSPLKTLSQGGSGSNNRSAVGLGGIEFDIVPSPSEAFDAGFTFGGGSGGGVHRGSISIRRGSEVTIATGGKSSSPQRRAVTLRLDGNEQTVVTSRGADESNDTNLTDRLSRAVGGTSKDFPVATKASLDQLKRVVGSDKEEVGDDVFTMDDHNLVEDASSAATANNSDNQMSLAQKLFHNSWFFRGDNAGLSQEEVEAKEKQISPVEKKLREMEKMKTLNLQMPINL